MQKINILVQSFKNCPVSTSNEIIRSKTCRLVLRHYYRFCIVQQAINYLTNYTNIYPMEAYLGHRKIFN